MHDHMHMLTCSNPWQAMKLVVSRQEANLCTNNNEQKKHQLQECTSSAETQAASPKPTMQRQLPPTTALVLRLTPALLRRLLLLLLPWLLIRCIRVGSRRLLRCCPWCWCLRIRAMVRLLPIPGPILRRLLILPLLLLLLWRCLSVCPMLRCWLSISPKRWGPRCCWGRRRATVGHVRWRLRPGGWCCSMWGLHWVRWVGWPLLVGVHWSLCGS
jgi:hypothetical protein